MQKILYCGPKNPESSNIDFTGVHKLLNQGYTVVSITPQYCAVASGTIGVRERWGGVVILLNEPIEQPNKNITI